MFAITIQNGIVFYKISNFLTIKYAGLFAAAGFLATLCLAILSGIPRSLFKNPDQIFDLSSVVLISGVVGARIFYVMTHFNSFENLWQMLDLFDGGLTLSGSIVFGSLVTAFYCKVRYGKVLVYLDFIAPLAAFVQIFMRMGCFFGGCCYGKIVNKNYMLPKVLYTNELSLAPNNQLLAASALYSAGLSVIIFLFLWTMFRQKHNPGKIIGWYFIAESGSRFVIDWTRGSREVVLLGLTWAQIFAILLIIFGALILKVTTGNFSESFPDNKEQS